MCYHIPLKMVAVILYCIINHSLTVYASLIDVIYINKHLLIYLYVLTAALYCVTVGYKTIIRCLSVAKCKLMLTPYDNM